MYKAKVDIFMRNIKYCLTFLVIIKSLFFFWLIIRWPANEFAANRYLFGFTLTLIDGLYAVTILKTAVIVRDTVMYGWLFRGRRCLAAIYVFGVFIAGAFFQVAAFCEISGFSNWRFLDSDYLYPLFGLLLLAGILGQFFLKDKTD